MSGVLYNSAPCPLETGLSLNLELGWREAIKHWCDPPASALCLGVEGLQVYMATPRFSFLL